MKLQNPTDPNYGLWHRLNLRSIPHQRSNKRLVYSQETRRLHLRPSFNRKSQLGSPTASAIKLNIFDLRGGERRQPRERRPRPIESPPHRSAGGESGGF